MFFDVLEDRVRESSSLLCIGLDPHISQLPEPTPAAAKEFCLKIINETHPYAAAFKPNSAFFEQFGADGFVALREVVDAIPTGIPVILDCKRGDIDSTAQAYAAAAFEVFGVHAVTLSPYMGWDSICPFVTGKYREKGAFVLCKTSNKSSNSLQKESTYGGSFVFENVAALVNQWNSTTCSDSGLNSACLGVVAGATDIDSLQKIREISPLVWILCPGVGAQGGEANRVCPVGLRADGSGLLVSVSRGISKAADMAAAALKLRDEINVFRCSNNSSNNNSSKNSSSNNNNSNNNNNNSSSNSSSSTKRSASDAFGHGDNAKQAPIVATVSSAAGAGAAAGELQAYQKKFIDFAIKERVLQFGSFKLKSGRMSPYFFNAGLFYSGASLITLSSCYAQAIRAAGVQFDVIFGPAYKGIPLATALSMSWSHLYQEEKDVSYNRKEAKDHGEGGMMVGASVKGRKVLIVDDVITAGTAIREAVTLLQKMGAEIVAVTVCLDRQEKTTETSDKSAIQQVEEEFGFPVVSVVRLHSLIQYITSQAANPASSTATDSCTGASLADIEAYRDKYGVQS